MGSAMKVDSETDLLGVWRNTIPARRAISVPNIMAMDDATPRSDVIFPDFRDAKIWSLAAS
jgi:hypothetical protein